MKYWFLGVFSICIASVVYSFYQTDENQQYLVHLRTDDIPATYRALTHMDYDLPGVNYEDGVIDVITGNHGLTALEDAGYDFEIETLSSENIQEELSPYIDPKEAIQILKEYAKKYPKLAKLVEIGKSLENFPMYALKISDNAEKNEDEPVVLFNGAHHAREVMTPEVVIDTVDLLLTNYGKDQKMTGWVDNAEIWLVPHVNPDGALAVFEGNLWWRKNKRVIDDKVYGVDLNRNYPFWWGKCNGSSSSPASQTYRGQAAGSEPETQAMVKLIGSIRPVFDISYHSYSELVIYPYGCNGKYAPEHQTMAEVGNKLGQLIQRDDGQGTYKAGLAWDILYGVDGDDLSFMQAEYGVMSYVIELNGSRQGFQPNYETWRDSTVKRLRPAWGYLLDRLSGSMIVLHVSDAVSGKPLEAEIAISTIVFKDAEPARRSNSSFGSFYRPVVAGKYTVTISKAGYKPAVVDVEVKDTNLKINVALTRESARYSMR